MGLWEIILIGIGLSMDAATVAMTNGMVYRHPKINQDLAIPLLFGGFQGLMPLIGYFAGGLFAHLITQYANILIFIILGIIGGKMLLDGIRPDKAKEKPVATLTYKTLALQAIATSIDAFAVGIGFSAVQVNIYYAVLIIGITTALISWLAIYIGRRFGDLFESKSQIFGGIILLIIAFKAIL